MALFLPKNKMEIFKQAKNCCEYGYETLIYDLKRYIKV